MSLRNTLLIGAAALAALGGAAMVPLAQAQTSGTTAEISSGPSQGPMGMQMQQGIGSRGDLVGAGAPTSFTCDPDGAVRMEAGLTRLASALALSPDQAALFDDYRTAALAAQTQLADACAVALPQPGSAETNPVTALQADQAIATARIAAIDATLPSLEALYKSLSADQQGQFGPQQQAFQNRGGGGFPGFGPGGRGGDDDGGFAMNRHGHDDDDGGAAFGNGFPFPFGSAPGNGRHDDDHGHQYRAQLSGGAFAGDDD